MYRILVADDDEDILNVMQLVLNMKGYIVELISDWSMIGKMVELFKPHLIILDINLGGADGRTICKQIKSTYQTEHIPVILFSANLITPESLKEVLADDFIPKPFDNNYLMQTVNKHLVLSDYVY